MIEPIQVEGLKELQRSLRRIDRTAPRGLRQAHNRAGQMLADEVQPQVPARTGKARRSVRARSGQREAVVIGGSTRVKHYAWLDFGGRVGIRNSVRRPYLKAGRYIYPTYVRLRPDITAVLHDELVDVARQAGLEPR